MAGPGDGQADQPAPGGGSATIDIMAGTGRVAFPDSLAGSSSRGGGDSDSNGVLTSQRRPGPFKRVESRVPMNDVTEQPLLHQAKKMIDDQRSK
jgi:hypothetical protein